MRRRSDPHDHPPRAARRTLASEIRNQFFVTSDGATNAPDTRLHVPLWRDRGVPEH